MNRNRKLALGLLFFQLVIFAVDQSDATCEPLQCGNDGPSQMGRCGKKQAVAWWCTDSPEYCQQSNTAGDPCYCCVEKCRNVGCEDKGGKCYDKEQPGMKCERSDDLCLSIPKPQVLSTDGLPVGTKVPCWCCKPEEPQTCVDKGCSGLWQGQGQCVRVTSLPWTEVEAKFDLRYTNPWVNKRCVDPSGDKDCCLCMRKRPCRDDGCYQAGGMCVDLKSSYLGNQNAYPRNAVDLGARIDGDLCKSEVTSTNTGSRKCCECYKRK